MKTLFEHCVSEHGATVLRVCRAILGPGPDADDAWSETFVSALQAWPELPESTNLQAWLVTVASRRSVDQLRRRRAVPMPTQELPTPPSASGNPEQQDPDLWRAVAALPERQRLAIAHHYLGGLTHVETAALTHSTPAAVRRAASDGLASLRRSLAASHDPRSNHVHR